MSVLKAHIPMGKNACNAKKFVLFAQEHCNAVYVPQDMFYSKLFV